METQIYRDEKGEYYIYGPDGKKIYLDIDAIETCVKRYAEAQKLLKEL